MISVLTVMLAAAAGGGAGKLPPDVAKEMAAAVMAVDKALGLESWPSHGVKPCVDQGGPDNPTKEVSRDDARRCALAAVEKGLPGLGKSYVLVVIMAQVGPETVAAFGIGDATGWGAYSCDPGRKCAPTKMVAGNKWGKRMLERQSKACGAASTIWLPEGQKACEQK